MIVLFSCADTMCMGCQEKHLAFVTDDKKKAADHSRDNHSKMWISEHSVSEAAGIVNTYNQFVNVATGEGVEE